jgi:SAM-dependent methyltransferase
MNVYRTRWEFVEPWVKGKAVLDVGPAELVGTVNKFKEERWLHKLVASAASRVVGLELSLEQVQALRELGYDIRQGDAEAFSLGETFDVVLAGELIEHLSNPGAFLDCARHHLNPGGILLLTTPNRFDAYKFLKTVQTGHIPGYHKPIAKHVCYFDENSLKDLLARYGFGDAVIGYAEVVSRPPTRLKVRTLNRLLRRYRPSLLPVLLVAACVLPPN